MRIEVLHPKRSNQICDSEQFMKMISGVWIGLYWEFSCSATVLEAIAAIHIQQHSMLKSFLWIIPKIEVILLTNVNDIQGCHDIRIEYMI